MIQWFNDFLSTYMFFKENKNMKPNTTGEHLKIQPAGNFDKTAENYCFFSDLAIKIAVIMRLPTADDGFLRTGLAELVPLPHSRYKSTGYLNRFHDVSVTIPRCYKISMSAVSFLVPPYSEILCLQNAFLWPMI